MRVKGIQKFEPWMTALPGLEAQIERQMMEWGSGVITDLDRFILPPLHMCDIDGNELEGEMEEYASRWRDEESHSTFGHTMHQGTKIQTQWHDDGRTTYHWGGPCAPTTYDEHGEEC